MEIKEIINENGDVQQLRISHVTYEEANIAASDWCEENNSLLKGIIPDGNTYIAEVCSDDYK